MNSSAGFFTFIYFLIALLTFGHASVCYRKIESFTAVEAVIGGVPAALGWPLYWSQDLFMTDSPCATKLKGE